MYPLANPGLLLFFLVSTADFPLVLSYDAIPIHIDTQADLDGQPNWDLGPSCGYSELVSDFHCGQGGGAVHVPEEDLHGEVGFWTGFESSAAYHITYEVQPGDESFEARVYNKYIVYMVINDGAAEHFRSHGWIDIRREFQSGDKVITIWLYHHDERSFNILDRLAINAELPPPPHGRPYKDFHPGPMNYKVYKYNNTTSASD